MSEEKILIIRTDRLGDVILTTPAARHLRKLFPKAYIAFMVRPEMSDVLRHNPDIDEVIIYDKYGSHKSAIETLRFALSLRRKRFTTAIAFHPTVRVHWLMFLAGIRKRIGYDRKMGCLLNSKIKHTKQEGEMHEVDYVGDMLSKAGYDISGYDRNPCLKTGEDEKRIIDVLIKTHNIDTGIKIIAIHAGASCHSKRWEPSGFAKVADALIEEKNIQIVFVGGEETEPYTDAVISAMRKGAADLTGLMHIGELAEFLSRCSLFISNDSGPVHVAVAVGTPVISIFGRNDPGLSSKRWGPIGETNISLHKDVGCDRCLAHDCESDFKCLKAITPYDVIVSAEELLKMKKS